MYTHVKGKGQGGWGYTLDASNYLQGIYYILSDVVFAMLVQIPEHWT